MPGMSSHFSTLKHFVQIPGSYLIPRKLRREKKKKKGGHQIIGNKVRAGACVRACACVCIYIHRERGKKPERAGKKKKKGDIRL